MCGYVWRMVTLALEHSKTGSEDWDEGHGLRFGGELGGRVVHSEACLSL